MNWILGNSSQSTVLTDNDDLYADHINQLRQSTPFSAVVGRSTLSQYYCDGVADELEINSAIDAVNLAGGGVVYLKAGIYHTTGSINLKTNVSLVGEGIGVTIIIGAATNYQLIRTVLSGTASSVYSNIEVSGITVQSYYGSCMVLNNVTRLIVKECDISFPNAASGQPIRQGIYAQHCQSVSIFNNSLSSLMGNGISIAQADQFAVYGNVLSPGIYGDDGIDIDWDFSDTSTLASNRGSIMGNSIKNVGRGNGIRCENSNWTSIIGNNIDSVSTDGGAGIKINASGSNSLEHVIVASNTISNCLTDGIAVQGTNATNVSITGNTLKTCGQTGGSNVRSGINLSSDGIACRNNTLDNCGKSGADGGAIVVFKKNNMDITDNRILNSSTGIRFWNGDSLQSYSGMHVSDNRFSGNSADIVADAVSNSTISNNSGLNPERYYSQGNASGATTFDRKNGSTINFTLTGNIVVTITDGKVRGDRLVLVGTQDATGGRTMSKPSNAKLLGGAFSPTSAAGSMDIWELEWNGTNWVELSRSLNVS